MKNLFFLLPACLLFSLIHAQSSVEWPHNSARWEVHYYDDFGQPLMDQVYTLGLDVVIGAHSYQPVGGFYVRGDSAGKVYVFDQDSMQEYLLYDFNMQMGDTVKYFWSDTLVVEYVGPVTVSDGSVRNAYDLYYPGMSGYGYHLIEGIGCLTHPFSPVPEPIVSGSSYLRCFFRNNHIVYTISTCVTDASLPLETNEVTVLPNPVRDRLQLKGLGPIENANFQFWNANGKACSFPGLGEGEWDLREAAPGLYVLQVSQGKGSQSLRFVVE